MKNKTLIASILGIIIAALVAYKAELEKPEVPKPAPAPTAIAADAGV